MKVHLTRTLWIENKIYPAGEQEISEQVLKGKTFATHIQAGHIVEAHTIRKTAIKSQAERAAELLEKLHSKHMKDATPEQAESLRGGVKSEGDGVSEMNMSDEAGPSVSSKSSKKK